MVRQRRGVFNDAAHQFEARAVARVAEYVGHADYQDLLGVVRVCNAAEAGTCRNLLSVRFRPEADVRRKMLKGCFRLGADIHLEPISGSC